MELGKTLIIFGGLLFALGVVLLLLPKGVQPLAWFGTLPGDISYARDNTFVFIPLTSMLVVSVLLSAILWLVRTIFPPG